LSPIQDSECFWVIDKEATLEIDQPFPSSTSVLSTESVILDRIAQGEFSSDDSGEEEDDDYI